MSQVAVMNSLMNSDLWSLRNYHSCHWKTRQRASLFWGGTGKWWPALKGCTQFFHTGPGKTDKIKLVSLRFGVAIHRKISFFGCAEAARTIQGRYLLRVVIRLPRDKAIRFGCVFYSPLFSWETLLNIPTNIRLTSLGLRPFLTGRLGQRWRGRRLNYNNDVIKL